MQCVSEWPHNYWKAQLCIWVWVHVFIWISSFQFFTVSGDSLKHWTALTSLLKLFDTLSLTDSDLSTLHTWLVWTFFMKLNYRLWLWQPEASPEATFLNHCLKAAEIITKNMFVDGIRFLFSFNVKQRNIFEDLFKIRVKNRDYALAGQCTTFRNNIFKIQKPSFTILLY